jgi:uncharacterized protein (DUF849 family)
MDILSELRIEIWCLLVRRVRASCVDIVSVCAMAARVNTKAANRRRASTQFALPRTLSNARSQNSSAFHLAQHYREMQIIQEKQVEREQIR